MYDKLQSVYFYLLEQFTGHYQEYFFNKHAHIFI